MDEQRRRPRKGLLYPAIGFTAANIGAGYYAISQSILGATGDAEPFQPRGTGHRHRHCF